MLRGLFLCACLVALFACSSEEHSLTWRILFDDSSLEARAVGYTARIRVGDCSSDESPWLYDESFRGDRGPSIPDLQPGTYAFSAIAIDESCLRFAQGCEEATLPVQGDSQVVVVLHGTDETSTCDGTCVNGLCSDVVDADVEDADVEEADIEDADYDAVDGEIDDADVDLPPVDLPCGPMTAEIVATSPGTGFLSLYEYEGQLYAGTFESGEIYSSRDGYSEPVLAMHSDGWIYTMYSYDGYLYANTGHQGEIWRSPEGVAWERVLAGESQDNGTGLASLSGYLYAVFTRHSNDTVLLYRSETGDDDSWELFDRYPFEPSPTTVRDLVVYDGKLILLYYDLDHDQGGIHLINIGTPGSEQYFFRGLRPISAHVWGGYLWLAGQSPIDEFAASVYRYDGRSLENVYEDSYRNDGRAISDYRGGLYFADDFDWGSTTGSAGLHCSNTGEPGDWMQVHAFEEAEAKDMAVYDGSLYVVTRQEGGNGHVYRMFPE